MTATSKPAPGRTVRQIAIAGSTDAGIATTVLCEDGTMWELDYREAGKWLQLPEVPGPERTSASSSTAFQLEQVRVYLANLLAGCASHCEPCPDAIGLATQIDVCLGERNARIAELEAENTRLRNEVEKLQIEFECIEQEICISENQIIEMEEEITRLRQAILEARECVGGDDLASNGMSCPENVNGILTAALKQKE